MLFSVPVLAQQGALMFSLDGTGVVLNPRRGLCSWLCCLMHFRGGEGSPIVGP